MNTRPTRQRARTEAVKTHLAAQWAIYRKEHSAELPDHGTPGSQQELIYQRAVLKLFRQFSREISATLY